MLYGIAALRNRPSLHSGKTAVGAGEPPFIDGRGEGFMLIGVAAETDPAETRVAATPETVKKFIGLGAEVAVEQGAGLKAGVPDADYQAAGARLVGADEALGADMVLKVRRPSDDELAQVKRGALGRRDHGPLWA